MAGALLRCPRQPGDAGLWTRICDRHKLILGFVASGEALMRAWIATALGAAALIAGTAVDAQHRCVPTASRPCLTTGKAVDFNSVPDVAKQIVNEEPISAPQKNPLSQPVPAASYTGPIFGATTTSGKRTPTVGYSWSLE